MPVSGILCRLQTRGILNHEIKVGHIAVVSEPQCLCHCFNVFTVICHYEALRDVPPCSTPSLFPYGGRDVVCDMYLIKDFAKEQSLVAAGLSALTLPNAGFSTATRNTVR